MAIHIKSPWEIEKMTKTGQLHTQIFAEVEPYIKAGVTTLELEQMIERAIRRVGGKAPQIGYQGSYPFATCMSLDEIVVHGFPDKRPLQDGDLLKVDFAFTYDGFTTDMARTYTIGKVSPEAEKLVRVTEEAFWVGLEYLKPGNRIGDVAAAVQDYVENQQACGACARWWATGWGGGCTKTPQCPTTASPAKAPSCAPA